MNVLGVVKTLRTDSSDGAERPPAPLSAEPVSVVFDQRDAVEFREVEERFHVGGDSAVMHDQYSFRAFRDRRCDAVGIDIAGYFGSMSTKTTVAPRNATAVAAELNAKLGTITSSPGPNSSSSAPNSSACVHEVVSRACVDPVIALSAAVADLVKRPSP